MKGQEAIVAVYGLMPQVLGDLPENYDPCQMIKEGMGSSCIGLV